MNIHKLLISIAFLSVYHTASALSHWEKSSEETLRLNSDSTFIWHQSTVDQNFASISDAFGTFSLNGDTIVLNSDGKKTLEVKCEKKTDTGNDSRRITIDNNIKIPYRPALFVLYMDTNYDTIFVTNLVRPDSWPLKNTMKYDFIELHKPKKIIDLMVDVWSLRPAEIEKINTHGGDIKLLCDFNRPRPARIFDNEKWIIKEDTVYPLTEDGYKSVYPLILNDSVYGSKREYYGKKYDGEYYGPKAYDGTPLEFGTNHEKVHYNSKYYKEIKNNNFKTYGIITRDKCYDKDGRIVAEGEYLSDTYNPFLRWYKYIKVGRWTYYEPDGTIRYVDY